MEERGGTTRLEKSKPYRYSKKGKNLIVTITEGSQFYASQKKISRTILNRLIPVLDSQLNESQCGFRSNRGCSDQLFNLRIIMQRAKEYNTPPYLFLIELCKAYDSINRNALWKVLRHSYNLPSKSINIIKAFHEETQGVVRYEGQTSKKFPIRSGVKQGDILSPLLFNLYLNAIINSALEKHEYWSKYYVEHQSSFNEQQM